MKNFLWSIWRLYFERITLFKSVSIRSHTKNRSPMILPLRGTYTTSYKLRIFSWTQFFIIMISRSTLFASILQGSLNSGKTYYVINMRQSLDCHLLFSLQINSWDDCPVSAFAYQLYRLVFKREIEKNLLENVTIHPQRNRVVWWLRYLWALLGLLLMRWRFLRFHHFFLI
jgi:hypothetical protein